MNRKGGKFTGGVLHWGSALCMLLCVLMSGTLVHGNPAEKPAKPSVKIETSMGAMVVELEPEKAPESVKNFLQYVDEKHYDGTIFHRVIKNFMIQCGGFTKDLGRKPTRGSIPNEAKNGLKNKRGTLAMARTSDPHSATSQFFINHRDNSSLDYPGQDGWGYAVFGNVVSGLDVLDKIASVKTATRSGMGNVPVETVLIQSITRAESKE